MNATEICCGENKGTMKLILEGERRIKLAMEGEGFEISSEGTPISPYHLLAGSLASCTALTLQSWAAGVGIDMAALTIVVEWEMVDERPKRVAQMNMELRWPGLPEDRIEAAEHIADLCPIHATLERATEITRRVNALPAAPRSA